MPAAAQAQPLLAYASFYQGGRKMLETRAQAITSPPEGRAGAMPIAFTIGLGRLPPGRYTCQISVLDPGAQRANYWRAPVLIVP